MGGSGSSFSSLASHLLLSLSRFFLCPSLSFLPSSSSTYWNSAALFRKDFSFPVELFQHLLTIWTWGGRQVGSAALEGLGGGSDVPGRLQAALSPSPVVWLGPGRDASAPSSFLSAQMPPRWQNGAQMQADRNLRVALRAHWAPCLWRVFSRVHRCGHSASALNLDTLSWEQRRALTIRSCSRLCSSRPCDPCKLCEEWRFSASESSSLEGPDHSVMPSREGKDPKEERCEFSVSPPYLPSGILAPPSRCCLSLKPDLPGSLSVSFRAAVSPGFGSQRGGLFRNKVGSFSIFVAFLQTLCPASSC